MVRLELPLPRAGDRPGDRVRASRARGCVDEFAEALAAGVLTRPVIVGPVTFLLLSKATDGAPEGFEPLSRLDDLLPVYAALLARARRRRGRAGSRSTSPPSSPTRGRPARATCSPRRRAPTRPLGERSAERPAIFVAAPYGSLGDALPVLAASPVEAIGLDLVRGDLAVLDGLALGPWPARPSSRGVVDGHNIWRTDLDAALARSRR